MYKVGMHLANNNVILPPQTDNQKKNNQFSPFFLNFPQNWIFFASSPGCTQQQQQNFLFFLLLKRDGKLIDINLLRFSSTK